MMSASICLVLQEGRGKSGGTGSGPDVGLAGS